MMSKGMNRIMSMLLKGFGTFVVVVALASSANAQEKQKKKAKKSTYQPPVLCAGYKPGKTNLVGERAGKKVQKAFEAYQAEDLEGAITILKDIKTEEGFDRAYVNQFLGQLVASKEGGAEESLKYLVPSVSQKFLNDAEHANTLKLVADLHIMLGKYEKSIGYYNQWLDFTCKNDGVIYARIATAYYEMEKYPEVIKPADLSIKYTDKAKIKPLPYQLKLQSYNERKQYKNALKVAEELVRVFPDDGKWWTMLGAFYMQTEDYKRALSTYQMADLRGFLETSNHYKGLSQLYSTNDMPYFAGKTLEKHMKSGLIEADDKMYGSLANSFHQSKDFKSAAKYYGKQADITKESDTYRKQGTLLLMAEDYSKAIPALKNAIAAGSKKQGAINLAIMEAYFYQNKFAEAHKYVKRAKEFKDGKRTASGWKPYIERKMDNRKISYTK